MVNIVSLIGYPSLRGEEWKHYLQNRRKRFMRKQRVRQLSSKFPVGDKKSRIDYLKTIESKKDFQRLFGKMKQQLRNI